MAELPRGTVTFVFTDIEGSTALLKRLRDGYGDVLARHQRILRDAFGARDGIEIDTQGDSFFFAFARARDAVAAVVDAQRALAAEEWPGAEEVRVRMGLQTGEPAIGEQRYVGFGVHRAARISAAGHGGQVLLSNATRELVEDELGDGLAIRPLGSFRLKDLDRPEQLFQLEVEGLRGELPAAEGREGRRAAPAAPSQRSGRGARRRDRGSRRDPALRARPRRLARAVGRRGGRQLARHLRPELEPARR